ncbi:hypothetical protein GCM10009678_42240 [Actinomadura kijaniata]
MERGGQAVDDQTAAAQLRHGPLPRLAPVTTAVMSPMGPKRNPEQRKSPEKLSRKGSTPVRGWRGSHGGMSILLNGA